MVTDAAVAAPEDEPVFAVVAPEEEHAMTSSKRDDDASRSERLLLGVGQTDGVSRPALPTIPMTNESVASKAKPSNSITRACEASEE